MFDVLSGKLCFLQEFDRQQEIAINNNMFRVVVARPPGGLLSIVLSFAGGIRVIWSCARHLIELSSTLVVAISRLSDIDFQWVRLS